jgi:two-component system sensor histidine kinase KdpD
MTAAPIIACISANAAAPRILRAAKALADAMQAPWQAVHVAAPADARQPAAEAERLLEAFRLAEKLGAETRQLNGDDAVGEVLAHAREQRASHLVLGASSRPAWTEAFSASFARRLLRDAGEIVLQVCSAEETPAPQMLAKALRPPPLGDPLGYVIAAAFVGVATLFAVPLDRALALPNVSLVYVLAVIAAAIRYGAATAAFTAVIAALAYNFFLTEPYYTFQIADPSNVWAVFFFLVVGIVVSAVAAHARAQTRVARRQAAEASALQALAHRLVGSDDAKGMADAAVEAASALIKARVVLLLARQDELQVVAEQPGPEMLGGDDMKAARHAFTSGREAGHGVSDLGEARWLFVPLPGERGPAGVIGARPFDDPIRLDPEQRRLMDLIADMTGLAIDRTRLSRAEGDARVEAQTERAKAALLSSISHDLRTPLATIRGSIESLLHFEDRHDPAARRELLQNAAIEAKKLSRFMESILDMARLEAGEVRAKCEPTDIADVIDSAVERVRLSPMPHVARDIATGLPSAHIDRALMETVIAALLENAGKYAPLSSTIVVKARQQGESIAIEVTDEGPGFPEHMLPHLFNKFVRGVEGDGRPPGPGLGLAVAKGLITAQGGTIEACNRSDRSGACVRIVVPIERR